MNVVELARVVHISGGIVHGACATTYDLEFPSLIDAAWFVESLGWKEQASIRDVISTFNAPAVIQVPVHFVKAFSILSTLEDCS